MSDDMQRVLDDMRNFGTGFHIDGKHIPAEDVYIELIESAIPAPE